MAKAPPISFDIVAHDLTRNAFAKVKQQMNGFVASALRLAGISSAGLVGANAVKGAVEFGTELTKIVTLVGVAEDQVAKWKDELIALSGELGRSPVELSRGLYNIVSAGVPAERAMETLVASAKASALGLGEVDTIADAVTSALNAYTKSGLSAGDATAILVAAVREGKLEADALAGAVGEVLPIASKLGVQFHEVAAAMASMSFTGTNANEAATQLNAILLTTFNGGEKAEKQLQRVGLSLSELRASLQERGLLATLKMLEERFKGSDAAMARVFGNVRSLRGVFNLLGENVDKTSRVFQVMATEGVSTLEKGMEKLERLDPGFKLRKSWEGLNAELVKTAQDYLPDVVSAFENVVGFINTLKRGGMDVAKLSAEQLKAEEQTLLSRLETLDKYNQRQGAAYEVMAKRLQDVRVAMEALVTMDAFGGADLPGAGGLPGLPSRPRPEPELDDSSLEKIEKVTEALRFEADQLGRVAEQQELYNQLRRAGVDLNSEAGQEIAGLVAHLQVLRSEQEQLEQSQERLNETGQFVGGAIVEAVDAATDRTRSLRDTVDDLARSFKRAALEALLLGQGPLAGLLGGGGGGAGGGLLGALLSSAAGAGAPVFATTVKLAGARAGGGRGAPGMGYLTGERRPEIFVPDAPGRFVPDFGAGGGGTQVTVHQQNAFYDTSPGVIQQMERRLASAKEQIKAEVMKGMKNRRANDPYFYEPSR